MPYIADFHIHSKHSRATSKEMDLESLTKWAATKGISMLGTGDFTHPVWFNDLKTKLVETEHGVYSYSGISFILTTEVSNIYFKAGRTRKVHNIIFAPSLKSAEETSRALAEYGSLSSDGRPILGLECDRMVKLISGIDPDIFVVPAHAWTPHFSVFGSNSGFDSPEECFEDQTPKIFSIETGLSSDPAMNWRCSKLDRFCLTSNSDAHSPAKLGREANVFKEKIDYKSLMDILKDKDLSRFLYTIEFFPEEGKYHWDGHRNCGARLPPAEAKRLNNACPVCGRKVTVGVLHRVEDLTDRDEGFELKARPSFRRLVPLMEIIADSLGVGSGSVSVEREYFRLTKTLGTEFRILLETPEDELKEACPDKIVKGITNVRKGDVDIIPGYDGEYGKVLALKGAGEKADKQMSFF